LNYGGGDDERTQGLFEVGGASVQIAYRAGAAGNSTGVSGTARLCIGRGGDEVYLGTWDGFGAHSVYAELRNIIWNEACATAGGGSIENPCLLRGAHNIKWMIGTGDFRTCLSLSKRILTQGAKERVPMPYYPFIQENSNLFIGIANLQYTYELFAGETWGYLVSERYN
jgi:Golgi apyrase